MRAVAKNERTMKFPFLDSIDKPKVIYTTVIPDKGSEADRRSGIQCKSEAKPHKTLDPVRASVSLKKRANGMTDRLA